MIAQGIIRLTTLPQWRQVSFTRGDHMPNELASDNLTTDVVGAITKALIAAKAGVIPSGVQERSGDYFAALDVRFDQPTTLATVVGLVQTALKAKTPNVALVEPTALTFMVQPDRHGRVTVVIKK